MHLWKSVQELNKEEGSVGLVLDECFKVLFLDNDL